MDMPPKKKPGSSVMTPGDRKRAVISVLQLQMPTAQGNKSEQGGGREPDDSDIYDAAQPVPMFEHEQPDKLVSSPEDDSGVDETILDSADDQPNKKRAKRKVKQEEIS